MPAAGASIAVDATEEECAPVGPNAAEEAALFSGQNIRTTEAGMATAGLGPVAEVEDETVKLPAMEELVQRIPVEARDVMDELFRAKFVRVQRVPKRALHS